MLSQRVGSVREEVDEQQRRHNELQSKYSDLMVVYEQLQPAVVA